MPRPFLLLTLQNAAWQLTNLFRSCLKTYPGEEGQVLSLRGHKRSGASGHPSESQGVCNPNEKQKPPPLAAERWNNFFRTHI